MANVTITRGTTLPNSSAKSDFHNLVDTATASVTNIVNADIDSAAGIVDTKLAQITTASKVAGSALVITGLTTVTGATGDLLYIADVSDSNNPKKIPISDIVALSAFTPSTSNALAGSIVQVVNTQTGTMATGTTTIPNDNTIPQNTEGDQYMSLAITPTSATNKLLITVTAILTSTVNTSHITGALFQDTTANALACARLGMATGSSGLAQTMTFSHYMTSGTTSSTTFKFRAGLEQANTLTFNGEAGASLMGGVLASSITIQEIKV